MSQNAIVKKVVRDGVVEVSLLRQLECGLSCSSCEGCTAKPKDEILALASDPIGTHPGDVVEVEMTQGSSIGAAMLVYLVPCVTLLLGYLVGKALGLSEGPSIGVGAVGLVLGFLPARIADRAIRSRETPEFTVMKLRGV